MRDIWKGCRRAAKITERKFRVWTIRTKRAMVWLAVNNAPRTGPGRLVVARRPIARVYQSPQTGSHYLAIPIYVRPHEPDDYRVRVDLSGLPTDRRAAVAEALAVKGFAPGSTAQDLSHVSRVVYSKEDAARAVGHAAAQYLRALTDIYGS